MALYYKAVNIEEVKNNNNKLDDINQKAYWDLYFFILISF